MIWISESDETEGLSVFTQYIICDPDNLVRP